MTSSVFKNCTQPTFTNGPPTIEATELSHIPFFGLLDSRACLLSIHLINKAEGSLSLLPLVPLRVVFFLAPNDL